MVNVNDHIAAIDLGSNTIMIATGGLNSDGKLVVTHTLTMESKGVSNGEVKNLAQVSQSISEAVAQMEQRFGVKITKAYAGISGFHLQCVKHPYHVYVSGVDGDVSQYDVKNLNSSMRGVQAPEGFKMLHISPQHYIVDGEEAKESPVGMFGKTLQTTFNLVLGANSKIVHLERAMALANIDLLGLKVNGLASAEAVVMDDEKEMGVAVVNLGAGVTDVCIYHDKIMRYVGVVPMGAEVINRDIKAYGILERYVEELKVNHGCALEEMADTSKLIKVPGRTARDAKSISYVNLSKIIEARLKDVVDFVMAEIDKAGYKGKLSAGLVLTGGGAKLAGIKEMFVKYSSMDVRVAKPEELVAEGSKELVSDESLSTVIGILYRGAEQSEVVITEEIEEPEIAEITPEEEVKNDQKDGDKEGESGDNGSHDGDVTGGQPETVKPQKEATPEPKKRSRLSQWLRNRIDDMTHYEDDIIDDNRKKEN